eukprot:683317-Pelagomonas_calceolata.AAC.1
MNSSVDVYTLQCTGHSTADPVHAWPLHPSSATAMFHKCKGTADATHSIHVEGTGASGDTLQKTNDQIQETL